MLALLWLASSLAMASDDAVIASITAKAREFDAGLPNYVCKQVTRRYQGKTLEGPWKEVDNFEEELTYFDRKEKYKLLLLNGKPTRKTHEQLRGGMRANNLFGSVLNGIFRPESKTEFTREPGTVTLNGREAIVMRYRVRQENSRWRTTSRGREYIRGFSGQVWADAANHSVLRFTGVIEAQPGDPAWLGRTRVDMRHAYVHIGGEERLVPVRSEVLVELDKGTRRNLVEFSDFKQYTVESKIEFK